MIPAGTTLTLDIQGTTGQFVPRTASDVEVDVSNALTPYLDVYNIQITRGSLLSDPLRLYYWNWPYTAVVIVRTRVDHAEADDVATYVRTAFYSASGEMPTVTVRGSGPQQTPDVTTGPSLLSASALAVVALVAVAIIVVKVS